jgi:SAM-dependent methyltransferase
VSDSRDPGEALSDPASGRVVDFWTERHSRPDGGSHDNFFSHPMVAGYVSLRAFGSWIGQLEAVCVQIGERTRPGARIFSPGCGRCDKELHLAAAFPDREFVAMDITPEILEQARAEAERRGVKNLRLEVGDFNSLELEPDSLDIVLGLGSIHHVEALEAFWEAVRRSLRPGGAVLAQEYVGPNRLQWTAAQVREGSRVLDEMIPDEHKPVHRQVVPVALEAIIAADPSEAVRSRDILPTLRSGGFELQGYVGVGCSLLQPVLMDQIGTYDPQNWDHNHLLTALFREEDRLLRAGVLEDDFAGFVAVPR